jgi:hypothetical protein
MSPVPESVGVGVGLVGSVPLGVDDGDVEGLVDWVGDVVEVGDEDGVVAAVDGDGDCDPVGLALAVADVAGQAVGEVVANGGRTVGIELGRLPGPGAVVEVGLELPPVDVY